MRARWRWLAASPRHLEFCPELEFDAAGSAGPGRSRVQNAGDSAEAGRRLDRNVRSAAGHRADAGARVLVFRVVQQVEGRGAEVDCQTFGYVRSEERRVGKECRSRGS